MNSKRGEAAASKIIIDMMLMDKYHWTPQQIDGIPKACLETMIAINQKYATESGNRKNNRIGN